MHAVIRRYAGATALIDEMDRRSQEVERVIATTPGFVSYQAVRSGDTLITVSICRDREATAETTRRAAAWVKENVRGGAVGAPEITEGDLFITFAATSSLSPGAMRS